MNQRADMTPRALSPETMWRAVLRRDSRYDGKFFLAVRTTGIYCRPTCTCRKPLQRNVAFFRSAGEATRAGFRPCKRCRPELVGGPAAAERALVASALSFMRSRLAERIRVEDIAAALAMSGSRFARRFRAADGRSPMRALADLRAERAEALLRNPTAGILEAAYEAGFQSTSAFARAFRRRTGVSPSAWRRTIQGGFRK